jgi:hypothetical protein
MNKTKHTTIKLTELELAELAHALYYRVSNKVYFNKKNTVMLLTDLLKRQ